KEGKAHGPMSAWGPVDGVPLRVGVRAVTDPGGDASLLPWSHRLPLIPARRPPCRPERGRHATKPPGTGGLRRIGVSRESRRLRAAAFADASSPRPSTPAAGH